MVFMIVSKRGFRSVESSSMRSFADPLLGVCIKDREFKLFFRSVKIDKKVIDLV